MKNRPSQSPQGEEKPSGWFFTPPWGSWRGLKGADEFVPFLGSTIGTKDFLVQTIADAGNTFGSTIDNGCNVFVGSSKFQQEADTELSGRKVVE